MPLVAQHEPLAERELERPPPAAELTRGRRDDSSNASSVRSLAMSSRLTRSQRSRVSASSSSPCATLMPRTTPARRRRSGSAARRRRAGARAVPPRGRRARRRHAEALKDVALAQRVDLAPAQRVDDRALRCAPSPRSGAPTPCECSSAFCTNNVETCRRACARGGRPRSPAARARRARRSPSAPARAAARRDSPSRARAGRSRARTPRRVELAQQQAQRSPVAARTARSSQRAA